MFVLFGWQLWGRQLGCAEQMGNEEDGNAATAVGSVSAAAGSPSPGAETAPSHPTKAASTGEITKSVSWKGLIESSPFSRREGRSMQSVPPDRPSSEKCKPRAARRFCEDLVYIFAPTAGLGVESRVVST
jgi:hypothetical protein